LSGEIDFGANVTLVLQIVILVLLIYGYRLFKARRYRNHGIVTVVATVLHTVSIVVVMIPMLLPDARHFVSAFLEPASIINLVHAGLGSVAEILAIYLVVRWAIHDFNVKGCAGKIRMSLTFYIWILALISGIIVYALPFIS
jgi:hypothetical protein